MNNRKLLEDVYNDFFGVEQNKEEQEVTKENIDMKGLYEEIDNLYIEDSSKELLKKIIEYMRKYHEKIETNYITFNLTIETNNNNLIDEISSILQKAAKEYDYTESSSLKNITFYKDVDFEDTYNKNAIIVIKDLKAFELLDTKDKEKLIHFLEENLDKKMITVLGDNKDNLTSFLSYSNNLTDKYFTFNIKEEKPTITELLNDIKDKIKLKEEDESKLLDYITGTYEESTLDYESYKNNLIKTISFEGKIPDLEENKTLDEVFKELDELVGLEKIKKTLRDLVDLIELKKKSNLNINDINLHMVFLGNPGTGKTTVARIIAGILYNLKYIRKNKLIEVSSKDLVAEYVGQTAPKTNAVIEKALGGVLFIDEAYSLADKGGNSYNGEAIATLIQAMENHRDDLVVIFAGYTKEMKAFLDSNSGIVSRIGYTLEFEDYTKEELAEIFINMMKKSGFTVEEEALNKVKDLVDEYKDTKNFGNARFIRNIYEKSVIKHASNTKNKKQKKILTTITKDDISDENLIKEI